MSQAPWTLVLNIPEGVEVGETVSAQLTDVTASTAALRVEDPSLEADQKNTAKIGFYANASSMVRLGAPLSPHGICILLFCLLQVRSISVQGGVGTCIALECLLYI